jgi:hypothetical protein
MSLFHSNQHKIKARSQLKGLERHLYAPELNRLVFDDGTVYSVPGERDMERAWRSYIESKRDC